MISKLQKTNDEVNQALVAHAKIRRRRKYIKNIDRKPVLENKKDMSKNKYCSCNKIGHYARSCTQGNKRGKRKHHAHTVDDDEPIPYKKTKEESKEEFVQA